MVDLLPTIQSQSQSQSQTQSASYWKEVLKQLLHSMGMSMVRESSITNFIDRIARFSRCSSSSTSSSSASGDKLKIIRGSELGSGISTNDSITNTNKPKTKAKQHLILAGWLELRKGFHTYIDQNARFTIFKTDVLVEMVNKGGGSGGGGKSKKNTNSNGNSNINSNGDSNGDSNTTTSMSDTGTTSGGGVDMVLLEKSAVLLGTNVCIYDVNTDTDTNTTTSQQIAIYGTNSSNSNSNNNTLASTTAIASSIVLPVELFHYMWCDHRTTRNSGSSNSAGSGSLPLMLGFATGIGSECVGVSISTTDTTPDTASSTLVQCVLSDFYPTNTNPTSNPISTTTSVFRINLGNWTVTITCSPHNPNTNTNPIPDTNPNTTSVDLSGSSMQDLLSGSFHYTYTNIPHNWSRITYILSSISQPAMKHINRYCSRLLKPMSSLDLRVRLGLPLLIPLPPLALGLGLAVDEGLGVDIGVDDLGLDTDTGTGSSGSSGSGSGLDMVFEYTHN